MDDAFGVRRCHARHHAPIQPQGGVERQGGPGDRIGQRATVDILHQKGRSAIDLEHIGHRYDVWVGQLGLGTALDQQARSEALAVDVQHLEGMHGAQHVVANPIDRGETAFTERQLDAVPVDATAGFQRRAHGR